MYRDYKFGTAQKVKEVWAAYKANAEKYSDAVWGEGTKSHCTGESVIQSIGARLRHVPYKGSAPAMTDLMGGQVPFSVDTVTAALPQLKSGKIKAIAVTTAKRSSQLPDVPTFAEAEYKDINADTWIMLVGPKGLPPAVFAKLEKTLAEIIAEPATKKALQEQGAEPAYANGAASLAQIESELPLMRAVASRAKIQAE